MVSGTEEGVQKYNEAFDVLLRDFRDGAIRDTSVVVHRSWEDLLPKVDELGEFFRVYAVILPDL